MTEPSRRGILRGVAAGTALVALGQTGALAAARSDAEVLERLLRLEGRLEALYDAGLASGAIEAGLGETLRDQEREHTRGLEGALRERGGSVPAGAGAAPARVRVPAGRAAFTRVALTLERRATAAYAEASATIADPGLRQPLGSIMTCEAAHEVALRAAAGAPLLAHTR